MDDEKTLNSREDTSPKETTEPEAVSRRKFMRKTAEVAALSLFGVLGLDAVVDRVLERVAENRAIGKLSDAAAGALKQHRLDYYASAHILCWACTHCDRGDHLGSYHCVTPGGVGCPNVFNPDGCNVEEGPYGCSTGIRTLTCEQIFECSMVNCDENNDNFLCAFTCQPLASHNCLSGYTGGP